MPTPRREQTIYTDGTSQQQRWQAELEPQYAVVDDRSFEQLVEATRCLAPQIAFYDNQHVVAGDWESFLPTPTDLNNLITQAEIDQSLSPHLALFVAFLRLFQYAQDDLNRFTQRHLDFYYEEILQFKHLPPSPDHVHVLFDLAKHISRHKLKKGSLLKAGKDVNGKSLLYQVDDELIINQTKVKQLKSVFIDKSWGHRIFEAPIANSLDGLGKELTEEKPSWAPFGESQLGRADEEKNMQAAEVGFAIASPVLRMTEGVRKGKLKLILDNPHGLNNKQLNDSFSIFLSSKKAWVAARNIQISDSSTSSPDVYSIDIEWKLNLKDPAIEPFEKDFLDTKIDSELPIVKLVLNHNASYYPFVELSDENLGIKNLRLEVTVEGLKNAQLSNDDAELNPLKSFYPFGAIPTIGSDFIIGCNELVDKTVNSMTLNVQWDDLPTGANGFSDHYAAYGGSRSNSSFKSDVHVFSNNQWSGSGDVELFSAISGTLNREAFPIPIYNGGFTVSDAKRVARLRLKNRDFGHQEFPNRYSAVAIAIAGGATQTLPEQPYTPKVKSFSLDYTASVNIGFSSSQPQTQFFHIEPYGSFVAGRNTQPTVVPFLKNGSLFIGLEKTNPPQNLSFLAQCVEGSGDADAALTSNDIDWSYLVENDWRAFESKAVLGDETLGFQEPGIIRLSFSKLGPTLTRMPKELTWVKAETSGNPEGAARLLQFSAQAVKATLVDIEKHPEHLDQALAADTISKMVEKTSAIKKIGQPFPSFDGVKGESQPKFYRRVSERLRHKHRAVTCWDYEHIVLQAFPELYKVKCLPHTGHHCTCGCGCSDTAEHSSTCSANNCKPGDVSLVVIPNTNLRYSDDPFQPKASPALRQRIEAYLKKLTPYLFVKVHVLNPCYEPVVVKCKVAFRAGYDPGFYLDELNESLKKLLAPWAFIEGEDIAIGGQIFGSTIIKFIENQPYVDFLRDFQMKHFPCYPGIGEMCITNEVDEYLDDFVVRPLKGNPIIASSPTSVLVSAYDHELSLVDENCECQESELPICGIGQMGIEQDFKIE